MSRTSVSLGDRVDGPVEARIQVLETHTIGDSGITVPGSTVVHANVTDGLHIVLPLAIAEQLRDTLAQVIEQHHALSAAPAA